METQNINLDIFKGEAFCRAACWFDINTLASDCDKRILWLGKAIDLKACQLATSIKLLADRWSMTAQTARQRLKEFADAGLIAMERIGTALIITVSPDMSQPEIEAKNEPQEDAQNLQQEVIQQIVETESESKPVEDKSLLIQKAKDKLHKCREKVKAKRIPRKLKKKLKDRQTAKSIQSGA